MPTMLNFINYFAKANIYIKIPIYVYNTKPSTRIYFFIYTTYKYKTDERDNEQPREARFLN